MGFGMDPRDHVEGAEEVSEESGGTIPILADTTAGTVRGADTAE